MSLHGADDHQSSADGQRDPPMSLRGLLPASEGYRSERERLSPDLRDEFDWLVLDYRYHALVHYAHPFVSYKVLADLVRGGWRRPISVTER